MFIMNFVGENALLEKGSIANHRGGVGELGENLLVNHATHVQSGTIGEVFNQTLVNHVLNEAAPTPDHFVEPITEEELAKALGLKSYTARALSLTCEKDIIQLPEELKGGWSQILEHFTHVGLKCTKKVVWNNDFDIALLPGHKDMPLDTFYFGREANRVRPDEKRLAMSESMNDKGEFLHLVQSVGVPIADTVFFETKEQLEGFSHLAFPLVFKINRSVAGLGTKVCRSLSDLEWCLQNLRSGVGFHIQKFLGWDAHFVSAQYVLSNGRARFITSSCNFISDETEHDGNWGGLLFDKQFGVNVDTVGAPIAKAIAQKGGAGWLGIDIGLTADGRMFPIEANLRYTAASYYYGTAHKIGMHEQMWAGRSYASSKPMSDIDLGEIAYTPKKGRGWILTNWGPMVVGKEQDDGSMKYGGGFLYVGPPDHELHQREEDKLRAFLA